MVSGPNFYIYGDGRWREVDINDGRVEGWGRARFVYAKRGKVNMAKTRSVLTALRDLKAGQKSAVRDGARLPHQNIKPQRKQERHADSSECDHSHFSHHCNHTGNPSINTIKQSSIKMTTGTTQSVTKIDAAIQTHLSQTLTFPEHSKKTTDKIRNESTSSDENIPTTITTKAMVNSNPKLAKLKLRKQWSLTGSEEVPPKKKVPSLKLEKADSTKYNLYKRKRSTSSDSLVWVVLPKAKDDKAKVMYNGKEYERRKSQPRKRRRISTSSKSSRESRPQKIVRTKTVGDISSPAQSNVKKTKSAPGHVVKNKHLVSSLSHALTSKSKQNSESINAQKVPESQERFKELIIGEDEVDLLRSYLMRTDSDFDLLKFDQDEEYKKQLFYTINPLVNVVRCPKISRMLRRDSQSEISLKDFASQLGLTSVSEKMVQRRYKMRNRNIDRNDKSDLENDKKTSRYIINGVNRRSDNLASCKRYSTDTDTETGSDKTETSFERKSTSIKTRSQNRGDVAKSMRYRRSQSLEDIKKIDRKNEVTKIFALKKKTAKSDGDYSDRDSSEVEKVKKKVLLKRKTRSTVNLDSSNFTDDPERYFKTSNKRALNNTNKSANEYKIDLTKSSDDSDSISETEQAKDKKQSSKKTNKSTILNDESIEVELKKKVVKSDKNYNKRNNTKESDSQSSSDEENVAETSKISKTPLRKRNKKGRFLKSNTVNKKNTGNGSDANSEVKSADEVNKKNRNKINSKQTDIQTDSDEENFVTKNSKSSKHNESQFPKRYTDKKDTSDSSDGNSEANNSLLIEVKSKSQKNKLNNSRNKNKIISTVESDKEFKSKTKITRQNNSVSKFKDNSEEEFKSQKDVRSNRQNKINGVKNNTNDRKNNMTDTEYNDSKIEERKKENRRSKKLRNNKITKESNESDSNKKQSPNKDKLKINKNAQIKLNNGTETLHLSNTNSSEVITKPVIAEIKSLAIKPRENIERPASVASSVQRVEYSNLEDHAIVSWVSLGGRARCVNGNRIWRELQEQYQTIAGQHRTWHSLRNRYLRSILPRLGQLALKPSLEAKLRADAATGEIKARKAEPRRNSIFAAPTIGALSRRVRARSSSSQDEEEPPHKRHKHDHTGKQ